MTLNVSGEKICYVNTDQCWLEHYPAEHKMWLLGIFARKRSRAQWFGRQNTAVFQALSKNQQKNSRVLETNSELQNEKVFLQ